MATKLTSLQKTVIEGLKAKKSIVQERLNNLTKLERDLTQEEGQAFKMFTTQLSEIDAAIAKASETVDRTAEEQARLDNMINNINVTVEKAVDMSNPDNSYRDMFIANIDNYVETMKTRRHELLLELDTNKQIMDLLKAYEAEGEVSDSFHQFINQLEDITDKIKITLGALNDRIANSAKMKKICSDNYDMISDINFFLNNPMNLADIEDRYKKFRK